MEPKHLLIFSNSKLDLMMETNFTKTNLMVRIFTILVIGIFSSVHSYAQSCACKQSIQVSLDESGQAVVTAEMLLADGSTCAGIQTVTVMATPTGNPITGSPNVNCNHAGKTLYGKVSNGANSCWTTLHIEDKIKPVITCPAGVMTLSCTQMATFVPTVTEACGPIKLDTISEVTSTNNCTGALSDNILKRVVRTYQATDANGNVSLPCTVTFDVTVADLAAIVFPVNYDIAAGNNPALVCDARYAKEANGNPSPTNQVVSSTETLLGTGFPTLNGINLLNNQDLYCGLMVSKSDAPAIKINCTTKIMRTWQVIEWSCLNRAPITRVQVLEIVDNVGPVISGLAPIIFGTTSNHTCNGTVTFPNATVTDNCAAATSLTVDITVYLNGDLATPGVFIKHGAPKTASLPVGTHSVVYTAYDACYNKTQQTILLDIEDNTPPVTICDELATVGLTSDGTAWVPASVFDDGSYDECKLEKYLVRRMNTTACAPCETPSFPGFKLLGSRNGHYYYASEHELIGKTAFKMAKAMGGYAVSFETRAEAEWLIGQLDDENLTDCYSIGLNINNLSTFPEFKWESGATFNFLDFFGSPLIDNNIGYVCVGVGGIGAFPNVQTNKYIIEITDPCGWSSYAQFCCSDVAANQMVAFRSIDASGNYNDCMVSAVIQDKIGPTITCPAHRTVNCDFAYDSANLAKDFGSPVVTDNCNPLPTPVETVVNTVNSCRIGTITRNFTVTDAGGRTATCSQVITFRPSASQLYEGPTARQWPRDTLVNGCGNPNSAAFLPAALGSPILTDGACSLVGAQHEDQTFSFNQPNSPACFKILRKWTVIDWCQTLPGGGYRIWTHTQEIKVIDNIAPVFLSNGAPLIGNLPTLSEDTYDATCQNGNITLKASASDVCTTVLRSSYKIDTNNNGTFDSISTVSNGNTIDASGSYPVGKHRIVYTFEDKCGNVTSKEQLFNIVNRKAPNAIVLQGLAISLMKVAEGEGMAEIWATDFDPEAKSSHPCGYPVLLSFTKVFVNNLGQMVGTPNWVYDCDDIDGPQEVTIWVAALTPAGDVVQTSVVTFIDVQDNNEICPDGRRVSVNGVLATEANVMLEEANVVLKGSERSMMTNKDGQFDFNNMLSGGTYSVIPEKNDDHLNGVSTLDLVMIQRHVLGLEKLTSPYKLIAADANKDGKVSASDLVELRKLILGTVSNFSNNKSWRFVDKGYNFVDANDAQGEAFPEVYNIDVLNTDMKTDFVAVKVGDVNGNAKANNFMNNTESRTATSLTLSTENGRFEAGQTVVIPVNVADMNTVSGMQFTMEFDSEVLSLTGVNPSAINVNDNNFGFANIHNGVLTVSWNAAKATQFNNNTTLFNLTFVAKENGNIAEIVQINSDVTKAEAYDSDAKVMAVTWRVNNTVTGYVLHQNTPNPFKETTNVSFELPEAMTATVTIYDVTGKVVSVANVDGLKGNNVVTFNRNDLKSGVMYYTLQAGSYKATKKMVVLE